MNETVIEVLKYALSLVVVATTALASYNINRIVLLSPGARSFLIVVTIAISAPMVVAPLVFPVPTLARAVLAYLMLLACVGCWILFALARPGHEVLVSIEEECSELRDVSVLGGTQTRAQLADIAERLRRRSQPPDQRQAATALIKSISPLVMLFFAKEKSMLKWGMGAFTLGRSLVKYFNAQHKNEA